MRKVFGLFLLILVIGSVSTFAARDVNVTRYVTANGSQEITWNYSPTAEGLRYHIITWTVADGVFSGCTVKLEGSSNGVTKDDIILNQTCTSNGGSAVTAGNYPHLYLTYGSMGTTSGSPVLAITYGGWVDNPVTSMDTSALSTAAKQSDGSQKTQIVDGSGNVIGATSNALDVNIKSGMSSTQYASGAAKGTETGTLAMGTDGTNIKAISTIAAGSKNPAAVAILDASGNQITSFGSSTVTANQSTAANLKATALIQDGSGNALTSAARGSERALSVQVVDGSGSQISSFGSSVSQSSTTSGQSGPLIQGAVTSSAPVYTTSNTNPLSLTTDGALRASIVNLPADTAVGSPVTESPIGTGGRYQVSPTAVDDGDRTNILTDSTGNLQVVGKGTAGTASGGVLTVQGQSGMTPVVVNGGGTAGSANSGVMSIQGISSMTAVQVSQAAIATGGATTYYLQSANTANLTSITDGATTLYGGLITNTNAAVRYVKLYNKATAPDPSACSANTDCPVMVIAVPGATTGGSITIPINSIGVNFGTGFGMAIVTGVGTTDETAVAADEIIVNLWYKH